MYTPENPSNNTDEVANILIVEDDRASMLALETLVESEHTRILKAYDAESAFDIIKTESRSLDVILLDHILPGTTGIELLKTIRSIPSINRIPVIMITASDKPEQINEAIRNNVFYYMVKPVQEEVVKTLVASAINDSKNRKKLVKDIEKHKNSFKNITNMTFEIKNLSEAENVASFIAACFPESEKRVYGIAELMINAIEHGNCGITYEEKGVLLEKKNWREEVNQRCNLPENCNKIVIVKFWKDDIGYFVEVKDQGPGFDWRPYIQIDPSRASHNHGRGIAQANATCFDAIQFSENGSKVTGYVKKNSGISW